MSAEPLRVLMTADAVGGVWPYSLDLARGLAEEGIEAVLAVLGPPPSADQRAEAASVPSLRLVETGLALDWLAADCSALREAAGALARLAGSVGADVVQLHSAALAALARFPAPVVAVQHSCVASWWEAVRGGPLPSDFAWRAALVREGLHSADLVVAPSAAFAAVTRRLYGLSATPRTVYNGRAAAAAAPRAQHDFVFTAGRLWDAGKDLATLDAAAARIGVPVLAAGPLAGPNGTEASFFNLRCLGSVGAAEVAERLAARPIFVSTARYEPFGLAVLEAAQAGCPLVLSDIATFRELWGDAATFVPPGDADAVARAVGTLIGDATVRQAAGEAARGRADTYTHRAMAARMAALYRDLPGPQHRARPMLARAMA